MALKFSNIMPDTLKFIHPLGGVKLIVGTYLHDHKLEDTTGAGDTDMLKEPGGMPMGSGNLRFIARTAGSAYDYAISGITWAASVATITTADYSSDPVVAGDVVNIDGVVPAAYNGAYEVQTASGTTQITVNMPYVPGTPPDYVSGGKMSVIGPGFSVYRGRLSFATDAGEHVDSGEQNCYMNTKKLKYIYQRDGNKTLYVDVEYEFSNPRITRGTAPT